MFDLTGKTALVTGATGGIGSAIARALHGQGATVALSGTRAEALEALAGELGERTLVLPCRLDDAAATAALPGAAEAALGSLDILVNNAGINIPQDSVDVTEEAWDAVMNINLKGAFFMAQAVGKVMIAQARGGRIINMTSQTGSVALAKRAAYCASKAGLNLVTKVLAMEWAAHEILVNAVAPTFIETELTREFLADPEFRQYALAKNLLKRFGTPDDVAGAVLYLASPAANMVTGHVLLVDAGWTAH